MSTAVATETPAVTFAIVRTPVGEFIIEATTSAGTSTVKDSKGSIRFYKTRSSARGAISRYRRGIQN